MHSPPTDNAAGGTRNGRGRRKHAEDSPRTHTRPTPPRPKIQPRALAATNCARQAHWPWCRPPRPISMAAGRQGGDVALLLVCIRHPNADFTSAPRSGMNVFFSRRCLHRQSPRILGHSTSAGKNWATSPRTAGPPWSSNHERDLTSTPTPATTPYCTVLGLCLADRAAGVFLHALTTSVRQSRRRANS